ncbi:MAG: 50S ribosomal protein L30 [Chloroflexi bacterium]|nr:50S ribosomal protein L30 [Chloroflexota bacterium]
MSKVRIKQIRSSIGKKPNQKATLKALGLKKINDVVEKEDNPSLRGMIKIVSHLVECN